MDHTLAAIYYQQKHSESFLVLWGSCFYRKHGLHHIYTAIGWPHACVGLLYAPAACSVKATYFSSFLLDTYTYFSSKNPDFLRLYRPIQQAPHVHVYFCLNVCKLIRLLADHDFTV